MGRSRWAVAGPGLLNGLTSCPLPLRRGSTMAPSAADVRGAYWATMRHAVDKPSREMSDPKELLLGFLDYYRSAIGRKVEGLSDSELRTSRLPSGWTPLELLKHLVFMEQRWLRWGSWLSPCRARCRHRHRSCY